MTALCVSLVASRVLRTSAEAVRSVRVVLGVGLLDLQIYLLSRLFSRWVLQRVDIVVELVRILTVVRYPLVTFPIGCLLMTFEIFIMGVGLSVIVLWTFRIDRTGLTSMIGPDGGRIMILVLLTVLIIFGFGRVRLTLMNWKLKVGSLVWHRIYYRRKRTVS